MLFSVRLLLCVCSQLLLSRDIRDPMDHGSGIVVLISGSTFESVTGVGAGVVISPRLGRRKLRTNKPM